ncbi:ankyrin [Acephala macrosclerotiorum]|nr:ankyrin [Acephala macrosclerotiorum]
MIPQVFTFLFLATLVAADSSAAQWNAFTNNFATNLAPIIALFGEQVTKQFLSESTSFLDSVIFGVAPLGILTAVVSVIRVYGNASLRSFIGRAQEPHGVAEAELCSSTSEDLGELWSSGGICRVFGHPKILEFLYTEKGEFYPKFSALMEDEASQSPSCGIDRPMGWFDSKEHPHWEEDTAHQGDKLANDSERRLDQRFAPYPNLSLNIGIQSVPKEILWVTAVFGVSLQLSFFVYATWATFYKQVLYDDGDRPQLWSFCLAVSGTALVVVGMILCAMLIERRSCERKFKEMAGDGPPTPKTVIFWLQPSQWVGGQLFNAFAHSEEKQKYITSWRVDTEPSRKDRDAVKHPLIILWTAILSCLLGFVCQFVGLRGLHGSIALYQLASTLCMAVIRALLRSSRLRLEENELKDLQRDIEGHELDWQALSIESSRHEASQSLMSELGTRKSFWCINDYPSLREPDEKRPSEKSYEWEGFDVKCETGSQIVGFRPSPDSKSESDIKVNCAKAAVIWMRSNEIEGDEPNKAARILHFRSRLAYLTGDPVTPLEQGWDTEVRTMAAQLQKALQESAEYIFSGNMELSGNWKDVRALAWSTTCQLSEPSKDSESPKLPIHFFMYRDNNGWRISKHQLEATLGLWWWSLKQLDGQRHLWTQKVMLVEADKKLDFKSALHLWVTQTLSNETPVQFTYQTALSLPMTALPRLEADGNEPGSGVLLAIETKSSQLQMIAQDIFTIFISRIAEIMEPLTEAVPRHTQMAATNALGTSADQPFLGLTNTHVQTIANKLVAAVIGSQEDALMSVISPLLQRSRLPHLDDVMEDLLSHARSLRRGKKFQVGEDLLKNLLPLGPLHFQERVIRGLGQLYRAAVRSQKQSEQDFGRRGFAKMKETCAMPQLSQQAEQILGHYEDVWKYFKERKTGSQTRQNPRILSGKFLDDLINQPVRPRGLTIVDEVKLSKENPEDILRILEWAIKKNCPELIEDLCEVNQALIHRTDDRQRTPIFWAIDYEAETFQALLEWPHIRPDEPDTKGRTPFLTAAKRGRHEVMELLLKQGVDTMARDHRGRTAFALAVENGHETVIKLLANMPLQSDDYGSALKVAAIKGWIETVKFLVQDLKADVNMALQNMDCGKFLVQDGKVDVPLRGNYGSVLAAAAHEGQIEIVKFLVQNANAIVDMPLQNGDYGSALAAATHGGQIEVIKFLVQNANANVNMLLKNGKYGSALAAAAYRGQFEVIKFLVQDANANLDMLLQGNYGSALAAAAAGHYTHNLEVIKFLVQSGNANIDMPLQGNYGSVLATAAYEGQIEIVKFLVQDANANVDMLLQGNYGSALAAAAASYYTDNLEVVKFLVQSGNANVDMLLQNGKYGSALAAAAEASRYTNNLEVIKLVQDGNADVNMPLQKGTYGSALAIAAYGGQTEVVKFLVQSGNANIDMPLQNGYYGSALAAAAANYYTDNLEVIKFLVQDGNANVDMLLQNGCYGSALVAAITNSHMHKLKIVKFLVQDGKATVDMPLQNGDYGSALVAAAYYGKTEIVKFLVQDGKANANIVLQGGKYRNALAAAYAGNCTETIKFLV